MRDSSYVECHLTLEPTDDFSFYRLEEIAPGWKASRFEEDHVDDAAGKWFLSFRLDYHTATRLPFHEDVDVVVLARSIVLDAVKNISRVGVMVRRWKIEDTLFDSKLGDTL